MMQNQKGHFIDKEWTMPILGIVGSTSLTVTITILLTYYNNKPVFDWHGVRLNAIVSIMTTISKALLAFVLDECLGQAKWIWLSRQRQPLNDLNVIDQASRGPLGCCKILRRSIARSFISIGAITIILSTAMDPLIQLTIGKRGDVIYEKARMPKSLTQSDIARDLSKPWLLQQVRNYLLSFFSFSFTDPPISQGS